MLGRAEPPVFVHHALLLRPSGEKLSKSSRDTGVHELRAAGRTPADVIGLAAAAVGLLPAERPVAASNAHELFF
jgi:glutamyl/glutaminyl-tRNA synthetase